MPNERKTEVITRNHFNKYLDKIIIEEQQSDNPKIAKLLKTASKSGSGAGYPEFIIQLNNNSDLIIVIECKANPSEHESESGDNPKKFAVDGVLLYSSYLSKDYDVLSIAISGESEKELKVSHFLQLKGEKKVISKFDNKLHLIDDYIEGYIKSPEKFRQDYDKLLVYSREINERLHHLKIVESDRALLISCILIALEKDDNYDSPFKLTYKQYQSPKQLSEFLLTTVRNKFENAKIGDEKINILTSRFDFIKSDTSLSNIDFALRDIITSVDENIKNFIETHEYFDVLGQLYIDFLRYANSDKGLGIVLTPPHITEFMAKLAEVNKDSIVYDNCTGTGGFLVSAMKVMIDDAGIDKNKILEIKHNQLIGVEYQAHIFALACSNIFIHQDGKSNIINGSCLDPKIIQQVKIKNPTVGLLNPPYKADKKKI